MNEEEKYKKLLKFIYETPNFPTAEELLTPQIETVESLKTKISFWYTRKEQMKKVNNSSMEIACGELIDRLLDKLNSLQNKK